MLRLRFTTRRVRLALAVLAASAAVAPATALGHAAFVGADPQPGVRLETSPQRVVLTFTEPLNDRLSRAELRTSEGKAVAVAAQAATAKRVVVRPAAPLPQGAYQVRWHTVSTEDGHALEGTFSFGVRAAAVGDEHQLEQSPLARAGWVRVTFRALLYGSVLLFAAGVLLPLLLRRYGRSWVTPAGLADGGHVDARAVARREHRLVGDLGWVAVAASVAATMAEAADAASGLSAVGLRDFLLSNPAGWARVLVLASLVLAALVVQRRRRWAAGLTIAALGGIAASGHASSADPRVPSVLNDWLHLVSGAVWLGGIGLLMLVFWPTLRGGGRPARQAIARHVLPLYGRVALPAFLVVSITGGVSMIAQLGRLDALWTTPYGRILSIKIALVALIAAASALHAWVLRPRLLAESGEAIGRVDARHWRLLRSEPLVALGIIAAVALLVSFPLPPQQLGEAGEAVAVAPACDPCPLPEPTAHELGVAEQAGSHLVAGWLRREGGEVRGTVRVADRAGEPAQAPFEVLGASEEKCGPGCRRFTLAAADTVRVRVREDGRSYVAALPAKWVPDSADRARRTLERTQKTMRRLQSVREVEVVSSGPSSYATTEYTVVAPNRMRFVTSGGVENVVIGTSKWLRTADTPWTKSSYGSGIPFSMRSWFRWTTYATAARVLDNRQENNRSVTELALMDPATPVWFRLVIDDATNRVVREQMTGRSHFLQSRYEAYNDNLVVRRPDVR